MKQKNAKRISIAKRAPRHPHVVDEKLDEAYRAMALDEAREAQAAEWGEGLIGDVADEQESAPARPW